MTFRLLVASPHSSLAAKSPAARLRNTLHSCAERLLNFSGAYPICWPRWSVSSSRRSAGTPLAPARKKIEHSPRLVLNVAVDSKLKTFLLRASDSGIEDTTWLESIADTSVRQAADALGRF